jgi:hypothetical protein
LKIPLPNLDDRRWADLVDEGRSLIPLNGPDWTDHNAHDPGVTLMELLAWVAEMDIYRLNRVSDHEKLKFLELVGVLPFPPRAARAVLELTLVTGNGPTPLPASIEFEGNDPNGVATEFTTFDEITIMPGGLQAVQYKDATGFHDQTDHLQRGEAFMALGAAPLPGAELYLGFSEPLPTGKQAVIYFSFAGPAAGRGERLRIIKEALRQRQLCQSLIPRNPCLTDSVLASSSDIASEASTRPPLSLPPHHSVRLAWEFFSAQDGWVELDPALGQVQDDTRSLTLNGSVRVTLPARHSKKSIGKVAPELYYLRCRFRAGSFDAPPKLADVFLNGVEAAQFVAVGKRWTIAPGVNPSGPDPVIGDYSALDLSFDAQGRISALKFHRRTEGGPPAFRVTEYQKPSDQDPGSLSLEAVLLGEGDGTPFQQLTLPAAPVIVGSPACGAAGGREPASLALFSLEDANWITWRLRLDLDASAASDSDFLLDATRGRITFGDGEKGRVLPPGALAFVSYDATRADLGDVAAGRIARLADSAHNRALLVNFEQVNSALARITNPAAAFEGAAAESLSAAEGRAIEVATATGRAVTLTDYESLAKSTPGTVVSRAAAHPNLHPSFPCLKAPGIIGLTILPALPVPRPQPSPGLIRAVRAYLNPRRVIGTRIEITGPSYREVAVRATVTAVTTASKSLLAAKIVDALNFFFSPFTGGPDKEGWPFGRDVYRSEVLQVIGDVPGVVHVLSLELVADGCDPQCGNVCLSPSQLVAAGPHNIQAV